VDYVGNVEQFEHEFATDLAVVAHAVERYQLPKDLKLSVHSGSDKFSLYAPIRRALGNNGAGVHLKTAGTTWLEELIGLAEAGAEGLALAKEIYAEAYEHQTELCRPYAAVIDIDASELPTPATVNSWTAEEYAGALRHDQDESALQSQPAPVAARGVQGRGQDGRAVYQDAGCLRRIHRAQRHHQPFRAPHPAAVSGRVSEAGPRPANT
jgi:tagaturonate epimerase